MGSRSLKKIKFSSILVFMILFLYLVFTLFPLLMSVLNSLKTEREIMNSIISLPSKMQFKNYVTAFQKINFLRSLWNTLVVTSIGVSGIVLFGSMAGYKLSRNSGKLSSLIFGVFVMSMLIPFHSIMVTLTSIAKNLNIQGSTIGLGLIYIGLGVPMAIFLYHGFTKSIPREIEEAAIIDGCGELQLFFLVIFPLLRPITATVMILNTLWIWNDFLLPLLMLVDSDHYTLLLSTNMLFGRYNNDWSSILAALILAMLPVVIIYLLLQKNIVKGVAEGAVKG